MKYGFIGCGNMGSAIAKAIEKQTDSIMVSDLSGKAKALGYAYGSAAEAAGQCQRLFLAVKPQVMGGVLEKLRPIWQEKKPLLDQLVKSFFGKHIHIPKTKYAILYIKCR